MNEEISSDEAEIKFSSKIITSEQNIKENISKVPKKSIFSKINEKLNIMIENAALNKVDKNKKFIKSPSYSDTENPKTISEKWNAPVPKIKSKVISCNYCHSLNNEDVNYCISCGNYLS